MGYYTRYRLEWSGEQAVHEACPHCGGTGKLLINDPVKRVVENDLLADAGAFTIASNLQESTKWYSHEEDMKAMSLRFPHVLFTLRGEGEEAGDVWVKYFKGGKVQTERLAVELPEFDQSKLA